MSCSSGSSITRKISSLAVTKIALPGSAGTGPLSVCRRWRKGARRYLIGRQRLSARVQWPVDYGEGFPDLAWNSIGGHGTAAGRGFRQPGGGEAKHPRCEKVAERLGNTPTICRRCYVHPEIIACYQEGSLLAELGNNLDSELPNDSDLFDCAPPERSQPKTRRRT